MRRAALVMALVGLGAPARAANPPETAALTPVAYTTAPAWELPLAPPRLADRLWPIPFGGRVSWVSTTVPNPDARRALGRVFLLRGTGIVFSPEFGSLCTRLRQAGLWTEDLRAVGDHWLCERLIAEQRAGRLNGPIILIGHSRGGRHVLTAARTLEKAGITVDLLVCLDVALAPTVPGNVRQALNLYFSGPRLYPASVLKPAPGATTHIENMDLAGPHSPVAVHGLNHVSLTANSAVQDFVVERILTVVRDAATFQRAAR